VQHNFYLFIKGPVYNLHLKFSVPKQQSPCQKVFLACTWDNESYLVLSPNFAKIKDFPSTEKRKNLQVYGKVPGSVKAVDDCKKHLANLYPLNNLCKKSLEFIVTKNSCSIFTSVQLIYLPNV